MYSLSENVRMTHVLTGSNGFTRQSTASPAGSTLRPLVFEPDSSDEVQLQQQQLYQSSQQLQQQQQLYQSQQQLYQSQQQLQQRQQLYQSQQQLSIAPISVENFACKATFLTITYSFLYRSI
jgi:hypothetical protein